MPLLQVIVMLLVLALVWWIFSSYVLPRVPEPFKTIIIIILALAVCLWLLSWVGVLGPLNWNLRRG